MKYEEKDEQGNTALHLAAVGKNVDLIKSLMRNKEQILEVNREAQTPLHLAAGTGAVRAIKTILNSPEGKKTLESEDSRHQTPLLIAASVGSKEVINLMISHGASVRKRNSDKETPLHICARFGSHCGTVVLLWYSGTVVLWYCGTVVLLFPIFPP